MPSARAVQFKFILCDARAVRFRPALSFSVGTEHTLSVTLYASDAAGVLRHTLPS